MEADKRVVPEKHISYLLEEDTISERTIEVKKLLHNSPDKIHHVAHTWMGHSGLNPLARVIIHHISEVPRKSQPHYNKEFHAMHDEHEPHHETHHHDVPHPYGDTHKSHQHGNHYSHVESHEHAPHGHGDNHHAGGHHPEHSGTEYHGGIFSSFVSTGHWFGDQGAYIFGMLGRIFGEIIGYILKMAAVIIIFGPTRTVILIILIGILLNTGIHINLPIGIMAGIAGIIHLIFTSINKLQGGHEKSHGGGGHENSGGHGGGHEHH